MRYGFGPVLHFIRIFFDGTCFSWLLHLQFSLPVVHAPLLLHSSIFFSSSFPSHSTTFPFLHYLTALLSMLHISLFLLSLHLRHSPLFIPSFLFFQCFYPLPSLLGSSRLLQLPGIHVSELSKRFSHLNHLKAVRASLCPEVRHLFQHTCACT